MNYVNVKWKRLIHSINSAFRITKYCRWLQSINNISTSVQEKATKLKTKERNKRKTEKNLVRLPANKGILLTNNNETNRMMKLTSEEHAQK